MHRLTDEDLRRCGIVGERVAGNRVRLTRVRRWKTWLDVPPTLTADGFVELNPDPPCELEDGILYAEPFATMTHGVTVTDCGSVLHDLADADGDLVPGSRVGMLMGRGPDTVMGVDVSLWGRAAEGEDDNWLTEPIRLGVEVLSAFDDEHEVLRRFGRLFDFGVPELWLADPETRSVRVCVPGRSPRRYDIGETFECESVEGPPVAVARLFRQLGRRDRRSAAASTPP